MVGKSLRVTLLITPACHLCVHAREVLKRLVSTWPLVIGEVQWHSPEGQELVRRDGVPFPPALYIEGVLAGYGRLSEGALRRVLVERFPP